MLTPQQIAQQRLIANKAKQAEQTQGNEGFEQEKLPEKKSVTKRFFARIPNSKFIFEDGTELIFYFGKADISNAQHIRELEAICPPKSTNPNIYTQDAPILPVKLAGSKVDPNRNAISEAERVRTELSMAGSKVSQETGPIVIGGINSGEGSTIDQELMSAASNAGQTPLGGNAIITEIALDQVDTANMAGSNS